MCCLGAYTCTPNMHAKAQSQATLSNLFRCTKYTFPSLVLLLVTDLLFFPSRHIHAHENTQTDNMARPASTHRVDMPIRRPCAAHTSIYTKQTIHTQQNTTNHRQLRQTSLDLQSISPYLASLRSTDIPMPGTESSSAAVGSGVSVYSFQRQVECMLTKTKPKKITMVGSNGRLYTFLLKGREDLHLDERMMQVCVCVCVYVYTFVCICTHMVGSNGRFIHVLA
jgi:hypothetical protein